MKNRLNLLKTAVFLMGLFFAPFIFTPASVLVTPDGEVHKVEGVRIDDGEYISINELASILNAEILWKRWQRKVTLKLDDGHQIVFTWFSPYMLYDSRIYNLSYAVRFKNGTLYVPLRSFQRIWNRVKAPPPAPPSTSSSVSGFNVLDLNATEKINGILIEIFLAHPLKYEIFIDQNRCVNVNFYQGKLDTLFFNRKKVTGFFRWIKAYQFENSAQLSFKLKKPFVTLTHNLKSDPHRIQISLIHPASTDSVSPSKLPESGKGRPQGDLLSRRSKRWISFLSGMEGQNTVTGWNSAEFFLACR